jgi:hypothetical protein
MAEDARPPADERWEHEAGETDRAFEAHFVSRRSPRQRMARAALVAGMIVAVVLLLGGFPTMRPQATSPVSGSTPVASTSFLANDNTFYLDTNLPDMTVTLDGRPVPSSELEARYPFHVARGRHQVSWQAGPFTPQSCVFSLPLAPNDTCQRTYGTGARHIFAEPSGDLLQIHVSLLTLAEGRQQALLSALSAAASGLSTVVESGEPYLTSAPNVPMADRPLRATLHVRLDLSATTPGAFMSACVFSRDGGETSPCLASVSLRSCAILCILPFSDSATDFMALAPVELQWDYSTLDGQPVALGQMIGVGGAATSVHYGLFHIIWDGARWHATLLSGPALGAPALVSGQQIADDLACIPAMDLAFNELTAQDWSGDVQMRFRSGPNPAEGCLVTMHGHDQRGNETAAQFIMRFGIFLAIDGSAHRVAPSLPVAGAPARAVANELEQYLGQVVNALPLGVVGD